MFRLWASRAVRRLRIHHLIRRDAWRNKHKFFYDNDELRDHNDQTFMGQEPHNSKETLDGLKDFSIPQDTFQLKIKQLYGKRPNFISPILSHVKLSTTTLEIESILHEKSYAAMKSYSEINSINETEPPVVGSIVECITNASSLETSLGIVLRPALSKFNENYNKLIVLTLTNEIIYVNTQDVVFHGHGVIEVEWLESLKVLDQRDDKFLYSRSILLDILRYFNNKLIEYGNILQNDNVLDIIYAKYSGQHNISSVSLPQAVLDVNLNAELANDVNSSYFNQTALLVALHSAMCSRPYQFILPDLVPGYRVTNIVEENTTNNLTKTPKYFLNSRRNFNSIYGLHQFLYNTQSSGLHKLEFDFAYFLKQQTSEQSKSGMDLSLYVNGDNSRIKEVINTLKFWIVYPHPKLTKLVESMPFLEDKSINNTFKLLQRLKVYDNKEISDIFLSSNLWNASTSPLVSYNSPLQLQNTLKHTYDLAPLDTFQYLRREKPYYTDNIIYGIPIGKKTVIGISLQKLNARNYLINVHIPDIITQLKPRGDVFKKMSKVSVFMSLLQNLLNDESIDLFPKHFIDFFALETNFEDETPIYPNLDSKPLRPISQNSESKKASQTCMTVSFTFNTHETNPFETLKDKIQFTFDSILEVKVKKLTEDDLEEALKGNRASALPFKLFRSRLVQEQKKLTNEDFHNIGFIYNVLKTHFSVRNINGSMNVDMGLRSNDLSDIMVRDNKIIIKGSERPLSRFFLEELDQFVGNMTARYCEEHHIPILTTGQELMQSLEDHIDTSRDQVIVHHDNLLLPNFSVTSFFQTLISRDSKGYVSMPAYLIGNSFLSRRVRRVGATNNVALGLKAGYVNMLDPMGRFECLLNQFQILSYKHLEFRDSVLLLLKPNHRLLAKEMSAAKGEGYNVNGPLRASVLEGLLPHLRNSDMVTKHLASRMKRYWTLRFLEQQLQEQTNEEALLLDTHTEYTTVVTLVGAAYPELGVRVSKAYVQELQIEVDLVTDEKRGLMIGGVVKCDKVVHLDVLGGVCVLHESPVF